MSKSKWEDALLLHIKSHPLPTPEQEYRFHPVRKWRFDMAYPDMMVAIEIHGGVWSQGRHTRGAGFSKDAEKYTEAALMGWRILHFTSADVESGAAIYAIERLFMEAAYKDIE